MLQICFFYTVYFCEILLKDINAQLRYSIQSGLHSNRFNIDYQTGKISTAVELDREEKDSYVLTIVVQDMDGNSTIGTVYNDTATVYITVKVCQIEFFHTFPISHFQYSGWATMHKATQDEAPIKQWIFFYFPGTSSSFDLWMEAQQEYRKQAI